ncbi:predicted protein [Histoplasma capsulatum H143]|uniref:Uncharacterized protein n=1 Tax=Ajellomyces capsulatus (strain H143) TaxID=544712 RepID=C6HCY4_AJECH|nr:predicted protein [Histoplasma capsulatum H143]
MSCTEHRALKLPNDDEKTEPRYPHGMWHACRIAEHYSQQADDRARSRRKKQSGQALRLPAECGAASQSQRQHQDQDQDQALRPFCFCGLSFFLKLPCKHDMILKTLSPASVSALIKVSIHSHLSDALALLFFPLPDFPMGVCLSPSAQYVFTYFPARDGQGGGVILSWLPRGYLSARPLSSG